jgi:oligoendopeptidase F
MRNHLVNHFIEKFKGTFFTQIMFAEFEKITHEMAVSLKTCAFNGLPCSAISCVIFSNSANIICVKKVQGKPLNAQVFSEIYEKLFKEYNGDSLVFDEEVKYDSSPSVFYFFIKYK